MSLRPEVEGYIELVTEGTAKGEVARAYVVLRNNALWPASRIIFRYKDGEGWESEHSFPRIDGAQTSLGKGHPEKPGVLRSPIDLPPRRPSPLEDPEWLGERKIISTTAIEYEDEHGLLRWRWSEEREASYARREDGIESSGGGPRSTSLIRLR